MAAGVPFKKIDKQQLEKEHLSVIAEIRNGETEYGAVRKLGHSWEKWSDYKRAHPELIEQYEHARDDCYRKWEQIIIDNAADTKDDILPNGVGGFHGNSAAILRARLKNDTLKWLMKTQRPDTYGDTVENKITGKDGSAITPSISINLAKNK